MLVQTLSSGIMIHCSMDELRRNGLSSDKLDHTTALALVEKALTPVKHPLPDYPELQIFFSKEELLIFVNAFLPSEGHFTVSSGIFS